MVGKKKRGDAPPAYLNYLFFDKEMNFKYGGYTQMTEEAYEDGTNREHERLYQEVVAEEPGYFYIYLSNDGTEGGEAFFDDFTILNLESYIVQQTDYYPYGLIARNFVREGEKETLELFQGKTYEELTGWYDFHARQYDAALGRWFGVGPQNQFASPYLAMGNNPVMIVDPDGELAITTAAVIGIVKAIGIGAAKGAAIAGGLYTGGVAISNGGFDNWNWNAFGNAVGRGALMGAATGGVSGLAQAAGQTAATAKGLSVFMSGSVNMMNHHDPERGFGLHSFGYFAAGAFGAAAGIEGGTGLGVLMGGTANVIAGYGAGDISSGYGAAQHFVGGGLSSIAGRQHYRSLGKAWDFDYGSDALDGFFAGKGLSSGARKALSYGAQNVAARFAYTDRKYFTGANFMNHLTGFAAGAAGGYLQYELMSDKMLKEIHPNYKRFTPSKILGLKMAYSTGFYGMEYSMNSSLTYNRQNWKGYFNYKAHSYFFKSLFYGAF